MEAAPKRQLFLCLDPIKESQQLCQFSFKYSKKSAIKNLESNNFRGFYNSESEEIVTVLELNLYLQSRNNKLATSVELMFLFGTLYTIGAFVDQLVFAIAFTD